MEVRISCHDCVLASCSVSKGRGYSCSKEGKMTCSKEISIEGAGSRIEMSALKGYDSDNLIRYTCFPVFSSFNSCLECLSSFIKGGQLDSIVQETLPYCLNYT